EGNHIDLSSMAAEADWQAPAGSFPDRRPSRVAGSNPMPIMAECDAGEFRAWLEERVHLGPSGQIPQLDNTLLTGRDRLMAVAAECDPDNLVCVSFQVAGFTASLRIPELDDTSPIGRQQ